MTPDFQAAILMGRRWDYLRALDRYTDAVNALSASLKQDCWRLAKELIPGAQVEIYADLRGGYLSKDWEPVIIVAPRNMSLYEDAHDSMPVAGTTLGALRALRDEIQKIAPSCVRVELIFAKRPTVIRYPTDVPEVLGVEWRCLSTGKIWYKGWDIPDNWLVATNGEKERLFCSRNAHGDPMEELFDLSEFAARVNVDPDNAGVIEGLRIRL
jgi:hypothetical protein